MSALTLCGKGLVRGWASRSLTRKRSQVRVLQRPRCCGGCWSPPARRRRLGERGRFAGCPRAGLEVLWGSLQWFGGRLGSSPAAPTQNPFVLQRSSAIGGGAQPPGRAVWSACGPASVLVPGRDGGDGGGQTQAGRAAAQAPPSESCAPNPTRSAGHSPSPRGATRPPAARGSPTRE